MTQQIINVGAAPGDGSGTPIRTSFIYINQNFTEIYGNVATLKANLASATGNVTFSGNVISTLSTNENLYITPNGTGNVVLSKLSVTTYTTLASPVFTGVPKLPVYTLDILPTVVPSGMIYVSNAAGAFGTGSMCFGNATAWVDVTTGNAVV